MMAVEATFSNSTSTANVATQDNIKLVENLVPATSSGSTVAGEESESNLTESVAQTTGRQSFTKEGRLRLRKWSNAVSRRMSLSSSRSSTPRVAPSPEPASNASSRASFVERRKPDSPFSPPPTQSYSLWFCCGGILPFNRTVRSSARLHTIEEDGANTSEDPVAGNSHSGDSTKNGPKSSTAKAESEQSEDRESDLNQPLLPPIEATTPFAHDVISSVSINEEVLVRRPCSESSVKADKISVVGTDGDSEAVEDGDVDLEDDEDDVSSDEEEALRANPQLSDIIAVTSQAPPPLLKPLLPIDTGKKCLVLDLDETLVHSSFRVVENPDYVVPVVLEGQVHKVYVLKRPGVDEFMRIVGEHYEVVVFTASLSKYADPVLDLLDIHKVVRHRLFRESCVLYGGNYVKDLSRIGRPLSDLIIVDNSPASYAFHPNNAIPITTWFNDTHDTELLDLVPFLVDLKDVSNVVNVLDNNSSM